MKILDSDHCIAVLRGQLNLSGWVRPDEELAVTAISVGELTHGACKSAQYEENLARLGILLAAVIILPYEERAANRFGHLKATLERVGERLDDLDLQIASIALHYGAPLITHNQRHFERVPGLTLEDWLA